MTTLVAPFHPNDRVGRDAVNLAVALAAFRDVTIRDELDLPANPQLFPPAFERIRATPTAPDDDVLHVGDPSVTPGERASVWAHPVYAGNEPVDGWSLIVGTNPAARDELGRVPVVPVGVDASLFPPHVRRVPRLLLVGDHEDVTQVADCVWDDYSDVGDMTVLDPTNASYTERARVYRDHSVGVFLDADQYRYAAEYAATGGCVVGPDDAEMGNLVGPDWAVPYPPGTAADRIAWWAAETLFDHRDTIEKGRIAAGYVRSALSWSHTAEQLHRTLLRGHL